MAEELRDALSAAMEATTASDTTTTATVAPATIAQPASTEEQKIGQPRSEDGKFAAKQQEATSEKGEATPTDPASVTKEEVKPTTTQDPLASAPKSWKLATREKWAAVDPEIKAEIHRREDEFHQGLEQYKQAATFGRNLSVAMRPFEANFAAANVTPEAAVQSILATDHVLRNGQPVQKLDRVVGLLQYYGIPLTAVVQYVQQAGGKPIDPNVAALHQEIAQLKGQQQQQASRQEEQIVQELKAELATFQADPKNEFFSEVRDDMANLLEAGLAKSFEEAYEKACWANPEVRAVMQKRAQAVKTSEQKLNASSTIKSAPLVDPNRTVDPSNLRATLEAGFSAT